MSTLKPSRLSSSATSRASLIGSLSGASASGYFALPITRAKRSPAANDGTVDATETINVRSSARRVFILRRSSSPTGADSSLRLGDLTLRRRHYQTAVAHRQPLAQQRLSRQLTATRTSHPEGINRARDVGQRWSRA